jgi:hypothetical protein
VEEREQGGRRRPAVRKQRKQRVAHPCGTMQRGWEQGCFVRRGLAKVRTELRLTGLADKLRRVL